MRAVLEQNRLALQQLRDPRKYHTFADAAAQRYMQRNVSSE